MLPIGGRRTSLACSTLALHIASVDSVCQPPNKQLQPTVIPNRMRAASAPLHYALAARWTAHRAAAELRR
jgi:hypothetical protein